jgi:H/ACA ribonucleoprotein complex subunit 3
MKDMPYRMKLCPKCQQYTLSQEECRTCGTSVANVHPPRFSLQDKYQDYRIKFFRAKMEKKYPEILKQEPSL